MCYVEHSPLYNLDELRLQFLGSEGWLGCPYDICALRKCPTYGDRYNNFDTCRGEVFQIVPEDGKYVKSGYKVRFRHLYGGKHQWIGCPNYNQCSRRSCPGTTFQALNFTRCGSEVLTIYARGKYRGDIVRNGDVVMLGYRTKFISIQGDGEGDDACLNVCPGSGPPTYFDYSRCPRNVFRIYKKL